MADEKKRPNVKHRGYVKSDSMEIGVGQTITVEFKGEDGKETRR